MKRNIRNSQLLCIVIFTCLLLYSCKDCGITFYRTEGIVFYAIKNDSNSIVISEKWSNPKYDRDYKLIRINGEYYLDIDSSEILCLSTKKAQRMPVSSHDTNNGDGWEEDKTMEKRGVIWIGKDEYYKSFFTTIGDEMPNAKGESIVKFIYYNKSYDITSIYNMCPLENFYPENSSSFVPSRKSRSDKYHKILMPSNDYIVSFDVVNEKDSIIVYSRKLSPQKDEKFKFVYKDGEYYWRNEGRDDILVMSTKKEIDKEYEIPKRARLYRVVIKSGKDNESITSIYRDALVDYNLVLQLHYDKSYNINKIQMQNPAIYNEVRN